MKQITDSEFLKDIKNGKVFFKEIAGSTMKQTVDSEFLKDIENEKVFLKEISGRDPDILGNYLGISDELSLMVKAYNEQLEGLVKLRLNSEIFDYLIISEPMEKTHLDNKRRNERDLSVRRKTISITRRQIVEMLEELERGKSGKRH